MPVRELTTRAERREAVPILRQLWTDADPEEVDEWIGADEYHLFGRFVEDWAEERDCDSVYETWGYVAERSL